MIYQITHLLDDKDSLIKLLKITEKEIILALKTEGSNYYVREQEKPNKYTVEYNLASKEIAYCIQEYTGDNLELFLSQAEILQSHCDTIVKNYLWLNGDPVIPEDYLLNKELEKICFYLYR